MGTKTDTVIKAFTKVVRENIHSSTIILFGSRAKGTFKKTSDYDFLLVSPEFRKWEWEERSARVYYLKREIPASMDIFCLTPQEFKEKKKQIGIVQQAVEEGIEITAQA